MTKEPFEDMHFNIYDSIHDAQDWLQNNGRTMCGNINKTEFIMTEF